MKDTQATLRKIKLSSAIISKQLFGGNFTSIFNGNGMQFKELREYSTDDDYRNIDWKTTAKMNRPFIKVNEEERQQHIVFLIDVSKSVEANNKKNIIAELCFLLAYSSIANDDKVAAVFFSDVIERTVPLSNSRNNISLIANYLLDYQPTQSGTNIQNALQYATRSFKRNAIVFIISDFFTPIDYQKEIAIASQKFKLIALQITNTLDIELNVSGLLPIYNSETGKIQLTEITKQTKMMLQQHQAALTHLFNANKTNFLQLNTDKDYLTRLKLFFDKQLSKNN
jgi:uncharacterized protein (DUF58 family)